MLNNLIVLVDNGIQIIFYTIVIFLLFINAYIDFKIGLLTDKINLIIVCISIGFRLLYIKEYYRFLYDVWLSMILLIVFALINKIFKDSIGLGDIKTYFMLLVAFGAYRALTIIFLANIICLIYFICNYLLRLYDGNIKQSKDFQQIKMGIFIFLSTLMQFMIEIFTIND